jgi:saccharopine dehydrogenase-like NADP-dependent oxidoreductase
MKRILVFGAGRVARPCVRHLLERGYAVTAADLSEANLEQVLGGHPNGRAIRADAGREAEAILRAEHPDLVICLLPPALMAPVARLCLDARVPLVHPAYLDEAQRALAGAVRAAGLVFLPELGLDPGIDHMSAARTVHRVRERGWRVESFRSVCGALPAPEANTNPWGYKLSWAPASLIGASLREARILREGREVVLPDGETYRHPELEEIEGMGWYEVYANGNALPYREAYGIPEARSLFRGTLRYLGWSETICGLNALSLVSEAPEDLRGLTFRGFLARRLGVPGPEVEEALCRRLGIPPHSAVLMRLRWLGLLEEEPVPEGMGCARDLVALLFDRKLGLDPGERDLVILRDEFLLRDPSGGRHRIRSTLVDFGDPGGDTSIARTTGLPPAVGADLILRGEIRTPGLHAPVLREVWEPLLAELEERGIRLKEEETELPG